MRLEGKICCACKVGLPPPHTPGEQYCQRCRPAPRKVYMFFFLRKGWHCAFLEPDLKTPLPRKFTFASEEKVRELVERAGGFKKLEDRQAFDYALTIGRGGVNLNLTEEQYKKLKLQDRPERFRTLQRP